jgi:hypothetical protein
LTPALSIQELFANSRAEFRLDDLKSIVDESRLVAPQFCTSSPKSQRRDGLMLARDMALFNMVEMPFPAVRELPDCDRYRSHAYSFLLPYEICIATASAMDALVSALVGSAERVHIIMRNACSDVATCQGYWHSPAFGMLHDNEQKVTARTILWVSAIILILLVGSNMAPDCTLAVGWNRHASPSVRSRMPIRKQRKPPIRVIRAYLSKKEPRLIDQPKFQRGRKALSRPRAR